MNDLHSLISDTYGTCIADPCKCLKNGWLGRKCPNWKSVRAKNWEELIKEMKGV